MTSVVKAAPHTCDLPRSGTMRPGEIRECDHCLRRWIYRAPGNPMYARWSRTTPNFLGGRAFRLAYRWYSNWLVSP